MTPALVLGAGSLLHQAAHDLATALDRQFAALGVTAQQAALLLHASRHQSSPSQLMSLLGTDTAGMTKLADRLEAKHLIERHPNPQDRRSVLITPTPDGQALVPQLAPVFGRVTRQLFNGFSPGEVSALTTMLERMRSNIATTATTPPAQPGQKPSRTAHPATASPHD
jgi:DNA-binding MarR family transcriptional regulator